jgi:hypothetical protein
VFPSELASCHAQYTIGLDDVRMPYSGIQVIMNRNNNRILIEPFNAINNRLKGLLIIVKITPKIETL